MTHEEAIQSNAAEGYLLGELRDAERDAFEEHFFDCRVCAETVREGATMFAAGRALAQDEPSFQKFRPAKTGWTRSWASGAVAAAAAVIVAYQGFIIPAMRTTAVMPRMEVVTPGTLLTGVTRSGENETNVRFEGNESIEIYIDDVPPEPSFPRYRVELRDAQGNAIAASDASAKQVRNQEGDPVHLLLRPLPAGRYVVAVEGVREDGNRSEIARRSLVVVQ
jgi:hypothetical protein